MAEDTDPLIRKSVSLRQSQWREVEDHRFAHRMATEAEAIRRLIRAGLEAEQKSAAKPRKKA